MVEIELDERIISEAAVRAWKESFASPDYSRQGGQGFEAVRGAVRKHLESVETHEAIREAVRASAKAMSEGIIRECVTEELRKQVKRIVKEERDGHTLFKEVVA